MAALAEKYPDVTLRINDRRLGHYSGDLSAYWQGLRWARERNLDFLAKLSQRYLIDIPGWLEESCQRLARTGLPMAAQEGFILLHGTLIRFPLRTEAVLLDVHAWTPYLHWLAPTPPMQCLVETHVARVARMISPDYLPWHLVDMDKGQRRQGILWHCANTVDEYHRFALAHGTELDEGFSCQFWYEQPNYDNR
jgi:hypothetical protein